MENGIAKRCERCGEPQSAERGLIRRVSEDDPREICTLCYGEEFGLSSTTKLYGFIAKVSDRKPESEDDALRISILQMIGPSAARFIPDDPDELDQMLLTLAYWALSMRSDDAAGWSIVAAEQEEPNDQDAPRDDPPPTPEGEAPAVAGSPAPD